MNGDGTDNLRDSFLKCDLISFSVVPFETIHESNTLGIVPLDTHPLNTQDFERVIYLVVQFGVADFE